MFIHYTTVYKWFGKSPDDTGLTLLRHVIFNKVIYNQIWQKLAKTVEYKGLL